MSSILTNNSAMVALQTMKQINRNMGQVQNQISTGMKVATAKDNAATWAISKVMESDVKGFSAIRESLALGSSTVNVARNAAETVTNLLTEIKEKIVLAQEENVDRAKIQDDIAQLRDQITSVVSAAQFNGLNLVDGTSTDDVNILSSLNRDSAGTTVTAAQITVERQDLSVDGALDIDGIDVTVDVDELDTIEAAIQTAIAASAAFGSVQKRIEIQQEFVGNLMDSMKSGIGALVDADMEEASARLQALQVQQQLGIQALSIANQSPQNILALFR